MPIKLFIRSLLCHPKQTCTAIKAIRSEIVGPVREHLKQAGEWLLTAIDNSATEGVSRKYSLNQKNGWDIGYVETTGYIIPTLLKLDEILDEKKYSDSSWKCGQWLLEKQTECGAFPDPETNQPIVFDTGQVIYGLHELAQKASSDKQKYMNAIDKAATWLCSIQEDDGSWLKHSYRDKPHSYHSRVAAPLYMAGQLLNNSKYINAASRHVEWVISNQLPNGFFGLSNFGEEDNLLHTIMYVLEGLLDIHRLNKDSNLLSSIERNANEWLRINSDRDLLLYSQYDENFECTNTEICITGLAQWSGVALDLYELTENASYLDCARKSIYYLRSKQLNTSDGSLNGALPGSVPLWGYYSAFCFPNWGVKFFIDSLIKYEKDELSLVDESLEWTNECFNHSDYKPDNDLGFTAHKYLKIISEEIIPDSEILDLGCGNGKYIETLASRFPDCKFYGIDPVYYDSKRIREGNAYRIPFESSSFDLVYTVEVLQHVKFLPVALSEIHRSLKKNGTLIICDRSVVSYLYVKKIYYEYRGFWMYPFDSPFKEKWYSISTWKSLLKKSGFSINKRYSFTGNKNRKLLENRFNIIIAKKV